MDFKKTLIPVVAIAFTMASASTVANPMLRLTTGFNTITITDNVGPDLSADAGVVQWSGSLGGWDVNLSGGTSSSLGPDAVPLLDLVGQHRSTGAAADDMVIEFSQEGYTNGALSPALTALFGNIGGTTNGAIRWELWVGGGAFDLGTEVLSGSHTSPPAAFSSSRSGLVALTSPYSVTLRVIVDHSDSLVGRPISSFNFEAKIPEPGTLLLLGSAMLGLALVRRRA
jgi:hypothetical protein